MSNPHPRRRGRPPGSNVWRDYVASLQEGSVSDVASEPVEGPRPGSIEYARAAKAEKQALKQPAVAVFGLKPTLSQALRPLGDLASINSVGTSLQHDVVKAMATGVTNHPPESRKSDEVMDCQFDGTLHTMSFRALAKMTKQKSLTKVGKRTTAIAQCVLEAAYFVWNILIVVLLKMCKLKSSSADSSSAEQQKTVPLVCCIRLRYDETPTKVRVDDPEVDPDNFQNTSADLKSSTASVHAKVLQTECSVGILLRTIANGSVPKYVFVHGRLPTPLFALKSTTARNTATALMRILDRLPEIKQLGSQSKFFFRHSCSDQAQANMAAEGLLTSEYASGAVPLHFLCDVHRLYRTIRTSMQGVDFDVSGILSFALALGEPGSAAALRKSLTSIFADKLAARCRILLKSFVSLFPLGLRT